jgi:hypothetical protein
MRRNELKFECVAPRTYRCPVGYVITGSSAEGWTLTHKTEHIGIYPAVRFAEDAAVIHFDKISGADTMLKNASQHIQD